MSLVALTHRYLQKMRERRDGVIINVSSTAGFQPIPFMATYAATKAFVSLFQEAIAEENRPFGIIVSALCPGPTETNFFNAARRRTFSGEGNADARRSGRNGSRRCAARQSKSNFWLDELPSAQPSELSSRIRWSRALSEKFCARKLIRNDWNIMDNG